MQPTLDQKSIDMQVVLKDTDLELEADSNLVEQVLINLLVNSIEAVKDVENPRIVVTAFMDNGKRINIRLADNGMGMSEEVQDKIFIPFFTTKKNGSGIGLSLCKQIMLLHRGTINVQSVPGKGTSFILQF